MKNKNRHNIYINVQKFSSIAFSLSHNNNNKSRHPSRSVSYFSKRLNRNDRPGSFASLGCCLVPCSSHISNKQTSFGISRSCACHMSCIQGFPVMPFTYFCVLCLPPATRESHFSFFTCYRQEITRALTKMGNKENMMTARLY